MSNKKIRSLEVPDDEQGVLASLLRLTHPELDGLVRALRDAQPTLDKVELVSRLRKEPELESVGDLSQILGSLVSLASTAYSEEIDVSEIIQEIVRAIQSDDVVELSDSDGDMLAKRLSALTATKCVEILAKGNVLLHANDSSFLSVKVISDFRPICSGEELVVSAGVIVHQLAIRSRKNGRTVTTYFSLDSEDLSSMQGAISRAVQKDKLLRNFASSSATPVLTPLPS